jgi:uncharacterized membrane protein
MAGKVMADIESLLARWQTAGVLDSEAAARIRAHEAGHASSSSGGHESSTGRKAGIAGWQGITALILGAILLACGVVLFVSAHWDELGPGARYTLVCAMVAVFHIGGGMVRENFRALSSALHAVGTISTGAAIALVGQIFNIQEHWPAAVLLWALAAIVGWMLLRDQAQQTLALLLVPAWIFSEIGDRVSGFIGADVYIGRLCFVWAILYITFFLPSRRKVVQAILYAAGIVAAVTGTVCMLWAWESWWATQRFIPFGTRVWAWIAIAAVPLIIAAFHGHKGLVPIAAAIAYVIALPWCYRTWKTSYFIGNGKTATYTQTGPNLLAHMLVALFAVFLCWWGVRMVSRVLVNLGIVGFAAAVVWFYFSDILDKMGRSLGLIGLGILFLAGGWLLERTRRRILAGMDKAKSPKRAPIAPAELKGSAQ